MPKILIQREKKEFVPELDRKVTVTKGRQYFVADSSRDFSTSLGNIKAKDMNAKDGATVKSTQGKDFVILSPTFIDLYKRLRKLPQSIILKDIGLILAETGVDKDSLVVDAGTGSGALSGFLAHLVKQVTTYEIREDFIENIKENFKLMGLKNIKVKQGDITKGISEKNVDLVTLDMPEPWEAVENSAKALKIGGFLVSYSPHTTQVQKFVKEVAKDPSLQILKTVELIERPWVIDEQRSRPDNAGIGHTAFLTFVRKIS